MNGRAGIDLPLFVDSAPMGYIPYPILHLFLEPLADVLNARAARLKGC